MKQKNKGNIIIIFFLNILIHDNIFIFLFFSLSLPNFQMANPFRFYDHHLLQTCSGWNNRMRPSFPTKNFQRQNNTGQKKKEKGNSTKAWLSYIENPFEHVTRLLVPHNR